MQAQLCAYLRVCNMSSKLLLRSPAMAKPCSLRLKGQLRLFVSFVAGFLSALLLLLQVYVNSRASDWSSAEQPTTTMLMSRTAETTALLEQQEVRVLCMVLTCPQNVQLNAQHVHATWGQRCSKLLFVSSESYAPLGVVQVVPPSMGSYEYLWNKTREGFRHVYEHYAEQYDWFLKADDDTYVIMENLRYMLSAYDADMPLHFGYKMTRYNVSYMSGGAGYVLSREALRRFMQQAYNSNKICPEGIVNATEDFYMGICLQNVGVHLIDSKYALMDDYQNKMFPLALNNFVDKGGSLLPDWLLNMNTSNVETGLACCSDYSISFHYASPDQMYLYEFLIYQLHVYGLSYQAKQRPTRLTAEQVTELFPLETNNDIKDLTQMSDKPENF